MSKRAHPSEHVSSQADNSSAPSSNKKVRRETDPEAASTLTQDDVALYDRQIRLWGMEAQTRMRNSSILVGGLTGLTNEVCKNLVLAGIGALTVADGAKVSVDDLGAQFFIAESDIGKNRAEASMERILNLNPRVKVAALAKDVGSMPEDFFAGFDFVVLSGADLATMIRIDNICRKHGIKFYAGVMAGFHGLFFCDLMLHSFVKEIKSGISKGDTPKISKVQRESHYVALEDALTKKWGPLSRKQTKNIAIPLFLAFIIVLKYQQQHGHLPTRKQDAEALPAFKNTYLESQSLEASVIKDDQLWTISAMLGRDLAPVCAIVGGILAQEIIKTMAQNDEPLNNFFVLDAMLSVGAVLPVSPPLPDANGSSSSKAVAMEIL
ncbi:hypothetical protein SmJEL517_g00567 [Synchytrium microbalum]|uniref:THIF-type NAD/FAD binding fold domain-containing protein n=1 Tax=Synchytrium microbalum TaxID=1806994 RepID=A0A507CCY1_9FUNG|nr:uncharacterized protein SmJEL517_g00567 [Synchytrium microbalum]TPX37472.1 hypothetical protein SmJEL517_g00567 [Synchytrium microbalum]